MKETFTTEKYNNLQKREKCSNDCEKYICLKLQK